MKIETRISFYAKRNLKKLMIKKEKLEAELLFVKKEIKKYELTLDFIRET